MILVRDVQQAVADAYSLPLRVMLEPDGLGSRHPLHSHPRQMAMALSRELVKARVGCGNQHGRISMPNIGRRFGGRDHSTVFYAIREVEKRRASNPVIRATMRLVIAGLLKRERAA